MPRRHRPGARALAILLATVAAAARAAEPPPAAPPGAQLYAQTCAACHDQPKDRIPPRAQIAKRTPEEIVQSLTSGTMRAQAAGLTLNERHAVAAFLTGRAPLEGLAAAPEKNPCVRREPFALAGAQWNGWGRDLENSRFQPQPGLAAVDVPRLKVKWAFGYRGSSVYGQPTVVGGRVFVSSVTGRAYALDARSGCTYWTFDSAAPARPAMSVAAVPGIAAPVAFLGDDSATVYALDAASGRLLWKQRLDSHAAARITGAPVFHGTRLYVPVSSLEEVAAAAPRYECCTFRGAVVALEARSGALAWRRYVIDEPAKAYRVASDGTQMRGPAGGAVWSAPTLDPPRNVLYVGTGNSYTDVPARHTNSIVALDLATGAIRWSRQMLAEDNYIVGCESTPRPANCPLKVGPDVDFGTSPILRTLPGGRQVLLTGGKSGVVHALDPAAGGRQLWEARVGTGGPIGGIEWGNAADATRMFVAVSDITDTGPKGPGGLTALDIATGRQLWYAAAPKPLCSWGTRSCAAAQSQAITAIPGVVFSGAQDGHLRAFAAGDGRIVWDFDTGLAFETVNGVPAAGGSLDHGGPTLAGGMLYVNSGYGRIMGQPGNVLLAFGVE